MENTTSSVKKRKDAVAKEKSKRCRHSLGKDDTLDSSNSASAGNDDDSVIPEPVPKMNTEAVARKNPDRQRQINHDDSMLALAKHLATAKPFILRSFSPRNGEGVWDSLSGTEWQEDFDICWTAIECGLKFRKLEGTRLMQNATFVSNTFNKYTRPKTKSQAKELWDLVGPDLQQDPTVVYAAFNCGAVLFPKLPHKFREKKNLLGGLKNQLFRWKLLPKRHKKDVDFALIAFRGGGHEPTFRCLLNVVENKEKLWAEGACQNPTNTECEDWLEIPPSIASNPKLMLHAISLEHFVAGYTSSELSNDFEFIRSVLEQDMLSLVSFKSTTYEHFPSILSKESIGQYLAHKKHNIHDLIKVIPKKLWNDREFVCFWVSAGCGIHDRMADSFLDDEEIILLHAKKYKGQVRCPFSFSYHFPDSSFRSSSKRLLNDKDFLRRLIPLAADPEDVMRAVGDSLKRDYDLLVVVGGSSPGYVPSQGFRHQMDQEVYIFNKMERQLRAYEGFFKGILCGTTQGSGSPLTMLDQGTDSHIKRIIAAYLDFPTGGQLGFLFRAGINLKLDGFNPYR